MKLITLRCEQCQHIWSGPGVTSCRCGSGSVVIMHVIDPPQIVDDVRFVMRFLTADGQEIEPTAGPVVILPGVGRS